MRAVDFLTPRFWLRRVRAESLWVYSISSGCCPDEWLAAVASRYDIERLGVRAVSEPELADVLVVQANLNGALLPEIRRAYEKMREPRYVVALGSCASFGGVCGDLAELPPSPPPLAGAVPVDLFVAGCPPRPEAIMYAFTRLKERIRRDG